MKIWECKIGEVADRLLPPGADFPMREAIEKVYAQVTGSEPDFLFSGWGWSGSGALLPDLAYQESGEPGPLLGLATTKQLLEEIKVRGETTASWSQEGVDMAIGAANLLDSLPGSLLDYSTVKGWA